MQHSLIIAVCCALSASAFAAEPAPAALKDSGCLSCHAATQKVVGPSYQSVAQKYAGQADAVADLVAAVQNGSKGKWGRIAMPAHRELAASDIEAMVRWILKQNG